MGSTGEDSDDDGFYERDSETNNDCETFASEESSASEDGDGVVAEQVRVGTAMGVGECGSILRRVQECDCGSAGVCYAESDLVATVAPTLTSSGDLRPVVAIPNFRGQFATVGVNNDDDCMEVGGPIREHRNSSKSPRKRMQLRAIGFATGMAARGEAVNDYGHTNRQPVRSGTSAELFGPSFISHAHPQLNLQLDKKLNRDNDNL